MVIIMGKQEADVQRIEFKTTTCFTLELILVE